MFVCVYVSGVLGLDMNIIHMPLGSLHVSSCTYGIVALGVYGNVPLETKATWEDSREILLPTILS